MSQYSRNERNANAGIVVGINPEQDFPGDPLAGVELQERLDSRAYALGGRDYCGPAPLVGDFVRGVPSTAFAEVEPTYKPRRSHARRVGKAWCRPRRSPWSPVTEKQHK